jgi:hypothetical protein
MFTPLHRNHEYCTAWCQCAAHDEVAPRKHLDDMCEANGNRKIRDPSQSDAEVKS